ncbi:hypothetical protein SH139x_003774 [Planctomycetaceae bacterium SH139]
MSRSRLIRCIPSNLPTVLALALICAIFASLTATPAYSAEPYLYKIEEDWELVINDPAPAIHSPQLTIYTSPVSDGASKYFQLQLNHAADAWFSGGGFQVAAAVNEEVMDRARSDVQTALASSGDTISWTVVMACLNNEFLYAVKDGNSASWGNFGGPEYLVRIPSGEIQDLTGYQYQNSFDSLDIGFGANRVQSLKLKQVRLFDSAGGVQEITVNQQF